MIYDRLTVAKSTTTKDGYFAGRARAARTGIQKYLGYEVGDTENPLKVYRIYRPESEVKAIDSLKTFVHKPITDGHPNEGVNRDNARREMTGVVGTKIQPDGQFIDVDFVIFDGATIDKINGGKSQISMGYDCDTVMEPGVTADGEEYDGYQRNIRINHLAVVDVARGGPELKFESRKARSAGNTNGTQKKDSGKMTTLTIDGLTVTLADDQSKQIVEKALRDAAAAAETVKAKDERIATLSAENATLRADMEKAKTTEEDMEAQVEKEISERDKARKDAASINSAVKTDGLSAKAIRAAIVSAQLGDDAKGFSDEQNASAFAVLAKAAASQSTNDGKSTVVQTKGRDAYIQRISGKKEAA